MRTEKPGISLPLDTIRASLDAAAADPARHSAEAISTHFDRLLDEAEKTPKSMRPAGIIAPRG